MSSVQRTVQYIRPYGRFCFVDCYLTQQRAEELRKLCSSRMQHRAPFKLIKAPLLVVVRAAAGLVQNDHVCAAAQRDNHVRVELVAKHGLHRLERISDSDTAS